MLFQNGMLSVRKLEEKDNYLLAKWLSDPFVLEFYEGRDNPFNLERVNQVFYDPEDDEVKCIIEFEGKEIGYIQFYLIDDASRKVYGYQMNHERIYGIDQFIGEVEYWNKGIGSQLVTSMVNYLVEQQQADKVVMEPHVQNLRALKCYEKCGFKKIRLLPKQELHEGEYRDCWLIEYNKSRTI
ncbi:GNAT family N-acetyltransferase [Sutcliffiella halmapala]|uniref:GNAT family N-acetyltransferase n=1 Tax=Sutcliffiella halmapala TaxID=79882 RepID=UPI0009955D30|nr:GNAT family N-acetyltransferase [Sutcliffiella halmapala]